MFSLFSLQSNLAEFLYKQRCNFLQYRKAIAVFCNSLVMITCLLSIAWSQLYTYIHLVDRQQEYALIQYAWIMLDSCFSMKLIYLIMTIRSQSHTSCIYCQCYFFSFFLTANCGGVCFFSLKATWTFISKSITTRSDNKKKAPGLYPFQI